jgi:hypothetical protein
MRHLLIGFLTAIIAFIGLLTIDVVNDIFFHMPLHLQYSAEQTTFSILSAMLIVAVVEEGVRFLMITKSIHSFGIGDTLQQRIINGVLFACGFMILEAGFSLLNSALSTTPTFFLLFPFMIHVILSLLFYIFLPVAKQISFRFLLLCIAIAAHAGANVIIFTIIQ